MPKYGKQVRCAQAWKTGALCPSMENRGAVPKYGKQGCGAQVWKTGALCPSMVPRASHPPSKHVTLTSLTCVASRRRRLLDAFTATAQTTEKKKKNKRGMFVNPLHFKHENRNGERKQETGGGGGERDVREGERGGGGWRKRDRRERGGGGDESVHNGLISSHKCSTALVLVICTARHVSESFVQSLAIVDSTNSLYNIQIYMYIEHTQMMSPKFSIQYTDTSWPVRRCLGICALR